MATQVQTRRGTTAEHSTFTGANGELTVDTTKKTVVVHDGSTLGGVPLAKESALGSYLTTANAALSYAPKDSPVFVGNPVGPTPMLGNRSNSLATTAYVVDGFAPLDSPVFTGTATAPSVTVTGSTVPTNGLYLPSANSVAISTGGSGRLFVDASGNVGIGLTPTEQLTVYDSFNGTSVIGGFKNISNLSVNTAAALELTADQATSRITTLRDGAGNSATTVISNTAGGVLGERLRITSAGLVGVGTSSPNTKLHVADGEFTISTGGNASDSGGIINFGITTFSTFSPMATIQGLLSNASGTELQGGLGFFTRPAGTAGQTLQRRMTISSQGNVGIGTTSPSELLHLTANANPTILLTDNQTANTNGSLSFRNGTYRFDTRFNGGNGVFIFTANNATTEYGRFDTSGRLLVGTSSSLAGAFGDQAGFQTVRSDGASGYTNWRFSNDAGGAVVYLNKSRATTTGTNTIVQNGDIAGSINFAGADGTTYHRCAAIEGVIDGTPGANDMPGRLVFSTTADGASSPTERMRISNAGAADFYGNANVIGARSASTAGTTDRLFFGAHSAVSTSTGTVTYTVWTNGNVVNTNNSYGSLSDIKLKENIVDATSQWDDIKALQVRKYNFKEGQTHTQIGLVAQEVELVSPGLVTESPDHDAEGNDLGTTTKSVNYSVLYMKAVKALQEAMERIETLEAKVAALESA